MATPREAPPGLIVGTRGPGGSAIPLDLLDDRAKRVERLRRLGLVEPLLARVASVWNDAPEPPPSGGLLDLLLEGTAGPKLRLGLFVRERVGPDRGRVGDGNRLDRSGARR